MKGLQKQVDDDDLGSDASTSEEEDEAGELLNETVDNKIWDTLNKIKNKDASCYDSAKNFFDGKKSQP